MIDFYWFICAVWKKFQFSSGFKCNTDKDCNDRGLCEADGDCRCNANWEASLDCSGEIFDFFIIFNTFWAYCRMQLDFIPIYHNWDSVLGIHIAHNIWKLNCKIDNNIDLLSYMLFQNFPVKLMIIAIMAKAPATLKQMNVTVMEDGMRPTAAVINAYFLFSWFLFFFCFVRLFVNHFF